MFCIFSLTDYSLKTVVLFIKYEISIYVSGEIYFKLSLTFRFRLISDRNFDCISKHLLDSFYMLVIRIIGVIKRITIFLVLRCLFSTKSFKHTGDWPSGPYIRFIRIFLSKSILWLDLVYEIIVLVVYIYIRYRIFPPNIVQ